MILIIIIWKDWPQVQAECLKKNKIQHIYNEKENWKILTNKEIYASVKNPTIIETIRLNRL